MAAIPAAGLPAYRRRARDASAPRGLAYLPGTSARL